MKSILREGLTGQFSAGDGGDNWWSKWSSGVRYCDEWKIVASATVGA